MASAVHAKARYFSTAACASSSWPELASPNHNACALSETKHAHTWDEAPTRNDNSTRASRKWMSVAGQWASVENIPKLMFVETSACVMHCSETAILHGKVDLLYR